MFSVVFTEVLQFSIMTVASISVGILVMRQVSPEMLNQFIPAGWRSPWFGRTLELDWTQLMPAVNKRIADDGWTMFSAFWGMLLFKGLLQAGAGPAPNYDMQRILSTRSPRDAAKMNGFVNVVLLIPRYMLITGLTVLALAYFSPQLRAMGDGVDFELDAPARDQELHPTGLLGLLIAALLAAFMSNFAATVNAAPAYIVNDIYRKYIRPDADQRTLVRMSYASSVGVVVVGTAMGFFVGSLNPMVQWIVSALYGGYTASNLLKWYWWRFNAWGYFWGMVAGIAGRGAGAGAAAERRADLRLPGHPRAVAHRLHRRHAGDAARRHRGARALLSARPAVGILEAGARPARGDASGARRQRRVQARHVQRGGRHRLADGAHGDGDLHRAARRARAGDLASGSCSCRRSS